MPERQIASFIIDLLKGSLPTRAPHTDATVQLARNEVQPQIRTKKELDKVSDDESVTSVAMDVDSDFSMLDADSGSESQPSAPEADAIPSSAESEEQALVLAPAGKRLKRTAGVIARIPQELWLYIFDMVDDLPTLHACSLVSRTWNPPAQEVLWREVLLDTGPRLRKFVRGVAFSATPKLARRVAARNPLTVTKSIEGIGEYLKPHRDGFLDFANDAGRRLSTVVAGRGIFMTGPRPAQPPTKQTSPNAEQLPTVVKGLGSMVKKLVVSSSEEKVILLQHIGSLLPNLQCLQFQHLSYDGTGPSLDARILNSLEWVIERISSLTVEDVDCPCWPELCRILRDHGGQLRNLNVEAVKDIDAFESTSNMSDVFPHLQRLEFLRLDGIPVGPNSSIEQLVVCCTNLTAITLDYCLDVTMDVLMVLWNGCANIRFLGMAGVVGPLSMPLMLEKRPSLKTLRLVDCDVFDEMFEEVAVKATQLEMLRLVFEDDGCDGIVTVSTELTDRSLKALANHNTTLRIIALTRCPNMTANALAQVIKNNPVHTLDLHKHPDCSIGGLDDQFIKDLGKTAEKVEVLNLFGQTELGEQCLVNAARLGFWRGLRSISINNLNVGPVVLDALREGCPLLEVLSIVDCPNIGAEAALGFVKGRVVKDIKPKELPKDPESADADTTSATNGSDTSDASTMAGNSEMEVHWDTHDAPSHHQPSSAISPESHPSSPPALLPPSASYLAPLPPSAMDYDLPSSASDPQPSSHDTRTFYTPEPPSPGPSMPSLDFPVLSERKLPTPPHPDADSDAENKDPAANEDARSSGDEGGGGSDDDNADDDDDDDDSNLSPPRNLRRIYTLAPDAEESSVIKRCDCWFVDEGLDIMSLWENAIRGAAGRGWMY
ncbi:hypothetical protein BDZ88DRAFT_131710 [Geranomyces variabilis]|nr:hypothetical protein BDZ88DRAFT_131710 [Geranomyces variabilis]KAJ3133501.1 hypothetical protein HDU90_005821 [Geranomyces variabilis]